MYYKMIDVSRLVHRRIEVATNDEYPSAFIDGENRHTVCHIIDRWSEAGAWWNGQLNRTVFRVQTQSDYLFDIEKTGGEWFIYRVWD